MIGSCNSSKGRSTARRPSSFGAPTTAVRAWAKVLRLARKGQRILDADIKKRGLGNLSQFDLLVRVGAYEGLSQGELADSLLVTRGNVVQMLDKMERGGLMVRKPEGRCNRIYLTDEGRNLYEQVVPPHEVLVDDLLSPLSEEQQGQLLGLLSAVDDATE